MTFQNPNPNETPVSMSLQTLPNSRRMYLSNRLNSMDVTDIDGARPRYIQKPRPIREVYNNRNDDIEKSLSKRLIPQEVAKPDRQLCVDDIQGTRTKVNKFVSTRCINPLQPVYQLPVVEYAPYPEVKFIRDNMQINDIEGTRTKETYAVRLQRSGKFQQKQKLPVQKRRYQHAPRQNNYLFDVTDINNPKQQFVRNQRHTNPMEPVYKVATSKDCDFTQIGFIQGSRPSQPKNRKNQVNFILDVRDIPGAVTRPTKKFISSKEQEIQGTKVGTSKRGISTNRKTNPLQPNYTYLGASENRQPVTFSRPKTAAQRLDAFISK